MMLINSMKWLAAAAGGAGLAVALGVGPALAADQPAETVDLVAEAATVSGAVGETVPLSLRIHHAGTAWLYPATTESADQPGAFFAVPGGTEVTAVPSGCIAVVDGVIDVANWRVPGHATYWCQGPVIELDGYMPGDSWTWTFDLKINEADSTPGSLTTHLTCDADECRDVDPANDTAPVTVNPVTEPATA